ncbi:MAG: pseudouridine synthase [Treponemataceae bacterium]
MSALNSMDKQNEKGEGALRLQAFLARCGVASRRASEKIILAGRVRINGNTITELGTKTYPGDVVELDGKCLKAEERKLYLALHKPEGYICSSSDPQGRPLAKDLLPASVSERVYNVGRLDLRSSGLILFTNDGTFASEVGHPSAEIEKEYLVDSTVPVPDTLFDDFRNGIAIDGILYKCADIERLGNRSLRIVLIEGKNKEIRRVFSAFHLHANKLQRVRIGSVLIGDLKEAESRPLTKSEIESLLSAAKGGRNGHCD